MAKKKKTVEQIVLAQMPGVRIVSTTPLEDAQAIAADAIGPGLAEIRKKYGPCEGEAEPEANLLAADATRTDDLEMVQVEPSTDDSSQGGKWVKTVIVSKSQGRIVGRQG
jgi:hypothetical protein